MLQEGSAPVPFVEACPGVGLSLTTAEGYALRITPPLTLSDTELAQGLNILDQVLESHS